MCNIKGTKIVVLKAIPWNTAVSKVLNLKAVIHVNILILANYHFS